MSGKYSGTIFDLFSRAPGITLPPGGTFFSLHLAACPLMRRRKHAAFASFSPLLLSPLSSHPPPRSFCRWAHDLSAIQPVVHQRSGAGIIFLTRCFLFGMVMMQWQVWGGCGEGVEAEMVVWIGREMGTCHCICSQSLRVNTIYYTI